MEQRSSSSVPISVVDAKSALELAQTKDIIENFWVDLCGLAKLRTEKSETFVRVSKPKMTYEFAKDLTSNVYIEINRLTARTHFSKEQIEEYLYKQSETMCDWFASEGMDNLVSPGVWEKCIELSQEDKDATPIESDGKKIVPNFWWSKHKIVWHYEMPFNIDMLNIIKRDYGFHNEAFDQDIILRSIFWSIRIFIHGGLNRSLDHLTLDHEKVIHKENTTFSGSADSVAPEGILEKMKNRIQQSFGGQNNAP